MTSVLGWMHVRFFWTLFTRTLLFFLVTKSVFICVDASKQRPRALQCGVQFPQLDLLVPGSLKKMKSVTVVRINCALNLDRYVNMLQDFFSKARRVGLGNIWFQRDCAAAHTSWVPTAVSWGYTVYNVMLKKRNVEYNVKWKKTKSTLFENKSTKIIYQRRLKHKIWKIQTVNYRELTPNNGSHKSEAQSNETAYRKYRSNEISQESNFNTKTYMNNLEKAWNLFRREKN